MKADDAERIRRLEDALKLLCDWTGYEPSKRNGVVTAAMDDILNGRDTPMVTKGRDLVRQQVEARNRQRSGARISR